MHKSAYNHGGARKGAGRKSIAKRPSAENPNGIADYKTDPAAIDTLMRFGDDNVYDRKAPRVYETESFQ